MLSFDILVLDVVVILISI